MQNTCHRSRTDYLIYDGEAIGQRLPDLETMDKKTFSANDVDQHVGERIRQRRILLGYTQEQLADALNISYQQVQKYETGANRVSSGRLFHIAQRLEVSVGYFFESLEQRAGTDAATLGQNGSYRHIIDLVRYFQAIDDSDVRSSVLSLVKSLGRESADTESVTEKAPTNGGHTNGGVSNGHGQAARD